MALSAKEVARELGTDARTLRKFFRSGDSPVDPVGQGSRYQVESKEMKKVKKAFDAWSTSSKKKEEKPPTAPEPAHTEEVDIELEGDDTPDHESMTVKELKEELKMRGLPINGSKKVLIARLQEDDEDALEDEDSDGMEDIEEELEPDDEELEEIELELDDEDF